MAWAQQFTSATRAALIFALEPAIACVTSYVLLGETLSTRGKMGAIAILAGVLLVEFRSAGFTGAESQRGCDVAVTKVSGNTSH
jgi:drug/metabolite transporter (DMT)-like permease